MYLSYKDIRKLYNSSLPRARILIITVQHQILSEVRLVISQVLLCWIWILESNCLLPQDF